MVVSNYIHEHLHYIDYFYIHKFWTFLSILLRGTSLSNRLFTHFFLSANHSIDAKSHPHPESTYLCDEKESLLQHAWKKGKKSLEMCEHLT